MISRIGIISGVADELSAFQPDVARQDIGTHHMPVQRLAWQSRDIFLLCAGIGKVAAATAATLLYARHDVELLAVIGTAGNIGDAGHGVFNITEAFQADFGAQRSDGLVHYTPGSWPIGPAKIDAYRAFPVSGFDLPAARIATSDLFIECGIHAARVRDALEASLVDMETAAVAQTAALLGIPWIAIKATTDDADGSGASSFVTNLAAAASAAARAAEEAILLL